ncbi:hypothetical protein BJ165DRAFT_1478737 [Panaeolus papilionaceus]|nr:hypothetical protein BJ165DRAFT_1478737 [Panaeolus papilionaceus]
MTLLIHDYEDSDHEATPPSPCYSSSSFSTSTYTDLALPLEIIELIIDELASTNDKESLRAFSLVSNTFVQRCQTKLFHTIDLGDRCIPGEFYYRRFLRVLSQRPNFRTCVRVLRLVDSYVWDTKTDCKWLASEESICDVLEQLPNLENFSLTFNTGKPSWSSLKPCIRHSLMRLAARPGVNAFSLGHIHGFPPAHLVTLTSIKHLTLIDLAIPSSSLSNNSDLDVLLGLGAPTHLVHAAKKKCRIETLSISDPSPATIYALSRIFSAREQPSLKSLKVGLPGEARADLVHSLWEIVKWSSACLTHLEWRTAIRPSTPALRPPPPIDLSILRSLRSLHFVVNFHSSIHPVFTHLISMLNQIRVSSRDTFEVLTIECMFLNTAELVACGSDWALLDGILSGSAGEANVNLDEVLHNADIALNDHGAISNGHHNLNGHGHATNTNGNGHAALNRHDTQNTHDTHLSLSSHIPSSSLFPHSLQGSSRTPSPPSFKLVPSAPGRRYPSSEPNPQFPALHTIIFSARIKTVRGFKESARAILQEQLPGCRRRGVRLMFGWEGV